MDGFRKAVKAAMGGTSSGIGGYTKIMGNAVATAEQMKSYLKAKNPSVAQSVLEDIQLTFLTSLAFFQPVLYMAGE